MVMIVISRRYCREQSQTVTDAMRKKLINKQMNQSDLLIYMDDLVDSGWAYAAQEKQGNCAFNSTTSSMTMEIDSCCFWCNIVTGKNKKQHAHLSC
uniref:Uncharacterized protein n=1 Tax=Arion vulgaris TaxID=1028688 RepID=A0A0B7AVN1_9EUPU